MRGSARIYDVRMAQFVLKIEKLSHIIGARGSQGLRSPSPIMAPAENYMHMENLARAPCSQFTGTPLNFKFECSVFKTIRHYLHCAVALPSFSFFLKKTVACLVMRANRSE